MGRLMKVLALTAALSIGAAVPADAATKVATKFGGIQSYGIEGVNDISSLDGRVKSKKAKCIVNRVVYAYWWDGAKWVTYGTDVTDVTGYFLINGSGPYNGTTYGFVASKAKLGNTVCKAATAQGRFDT
jgi:hypothetical protein